MKGINLRCDGAPPFGHPIGPECEIEDVPTTVSSADDKCDDCAKRHELPKTPLNYLE